MRLIVVDDVGDGTSNQGERALQHPNTCEFHDMLIDGFLG